MTYLIGLTIAAAIAWGFWKITRYFWLKRYYRFKGVKDVDVLTASQLHTQQQRFILDVREPSEYAAAHIDGVPLVPLGELAGRVEELQQHKDEMILIICRGGVRSAKACLILERAGFKDPVNIAGGMTAWKKQGLPFIDGSQDPATA